MQLTKQLRISSFQIITGSFLGVILTGTVLLMLPISSAEGVPVPFGDALFTATSAVCVTGLVVHDTFRYWSLFGQFVILFLIQIGGLGTITLATVITMLAGRKVSLFQRSIMKDAVSAEQYGGIVRFSLYILSSTLAVEFLGVLSLFPVFFRKYSLPRCILYSLFHSVSAFCNAGFDLMGQESPFSSLTGFTGNISVNLTIMTLIIVGGLGFRTWQDIGNHKLHFHKYRLQTKLILTTTLILIFLPALFFFIFEYKGLPLRKDPRVAVPVRDHQNGRIQYYRLRKVYRQRKTHQHHSHADRRLPRIHGGRHEDHDLRDSSAQRKRNLPPQRRGVRLFPQDQRPDCKNSGHHIRSLHQSFHNKRCHHQPGRVASSAHVHVRDSFRHRDSGTDAGHHARAWTSVESGADLFDVFWQGRRTDPDLCSRSVPPNAQPAAAP